MNESATTYEGQSKIRSYARVLYENYRVHIMSSRKVSMPKWAQASVYEQREFINEAEQVLS